MDEFDTGTADDATVRLDGTTGANNLVNNAANEAGKIPASDSASAATSNSAGNMPERAVRGEANLSPETSTVFTPGTLFLNKYKIGERIGQGGMGVVYRCTQVFIGKEMAIKTLNKSALTDETILRFQTEARAVGTLAHANIVSVSDFGVTEDGVPYMVMDYVPGRTLQDILNAQGQLPLDMVLDIFIQCSDALAHAHENKVLHRDIKPSNIVLLKEENIESGSIRILDFGIAKIAGDGTQTQELTKTGTVIGSPLYMSPEQSIGKRMDYRTDIYSLGCVLFECLCGTPPFQGDTVIETLMLHQTETPKTLKEASLGREFPKRLQDLISSMMEKNFEQRMSSMHTVQHELEEIKAQLKNPSAKTQAVVVQKKEAEAAKGISVSAMLVAIGAIVAMILVTMIYQLSKTEKPIGKIAEISPTLASSTEIQAAYDQRVKRGILDARMRGNEEVDLKSVDFSQSQFEILAKEKWIRRLNLVECHQITPKGLETILANNLDKLSLRSSDLSDECLEAISKSQTLKILDLTRCTGVSEKGLRNLVKTKSLTMLYISRLPFSNDFLRAFIETHPVISDLDISENTLVNDSTMGVLAEIKSPTSFNISQTRVTSEGLKYLRENVVSLVMIGDNLVDDKGAENLTVHCPGLRILHITGTSITTKGILQLAKLKLLEHLMIGVVPGATSADKDKIRKTFAAKKVNLYNY